MSQFCTLLPHIIFFLTYCSIFELTLKSSLYLQMADESHHRDVNHTFADMNSDDPNPFLNSHKGEDDAVCYLKLDSYYIENLLFY